MVNASMNWERHRPGSLWGRSFRVRSIPVALLPMVVLLV